MKKLAATVGAAVLLLAGCATGGGPEIAPSPTPTKTQPTATVTAQAAEFVTIECSNSDYTTTQKFAVERTDTPPNFAAIWSGDNTSCNVWDDVKATTDIELDARLVAGSATVDTLYALCAAVDPTDTYFNGTHVASDAQIPEIKATLKLCPEHPLAAQLQATLERTTTAAAAPPPPAPVWERYGPVPSNLLDLGDDYYLGMGASICADVQAGKIETGFLHGYLTGGNLPEYVKPQAANVRMAARSIELTCPESMDQFVTLLDQYDAAHGPY